jgi:glycoside hydrolase family 92
LENGRKFEIVAEGVDDENFYIQQVDLNGKSGYYLSHDDLLKGGKLSFRMGNSPKY